MSLCVDEVGVMEVASAAAPVAHALAYRVPVIGHRSSVAV